MDNQQDTSSPSRPPEQRGGFKVATRPSSPKPKRVFYSPKQSRKPSIPNDPANNQPNNLVSPSPFRRTKNFASFDYVRKEVKSLPISPSTSRSVPEHPVDSHFTLDQKQKAHSLDQETTSSPSLSNATDRATTIFSASLSPSDNRKTGVLWGATPEVHASEDNIGHVKRDNSPVNRRDSVRKSKGPSLKKVSGTSSQSPDSISAVKELDKKLGDGLPVEDGPRGSKFVLEGKGDKGENGGTMGGHSFAITTLKKPTWCHVCREFIWGILYQAHECVICHAICHHRCLPSSSSIPCVPPTVLSPTPSPLSPEIKSSKSRNGPAYRPLRKPPKTPSSPPLGSPSKEGFMGSSSPITVSLSKEKQAYLFDLAESKNKKSFASALSQEKSAHQQALLESTNEQGLTLFHAACQSGKLAIAEYLYKRLPSLLHTTDPLSWTALHFACHSGHLEICHFLLTNGATPTDTGDGSSPLHLLATHPDIGEGQPALYLQIILLLLKMRPEIVNAQNEQGETTLHIAAMSGSHKTVLYVSKFGANIRLQLRSLRGETALSYAVRTKSKAILSLLLEMGADPMARTTRDGNCRDIAAMMGDDDALEIIDEFLEQQKHAGTLVDSLVREASLRSLGRKRLVALNESVSSRQERETASGPSDRSAEKEKMMMMLKMAASDKGKWKVSSKGHTPPISPSSETTETPQTAAPPQFSSLPSFPALQNLPASVLQASMGALSTDTKPPLTGSDRPLFCSSSPPSIPNSNPPTGSLSPQAPHLSPSRHPFSRTSFHRLSPSPSPSSHSSMSNSSHSSHSSRSSFLAPSSPTEETDRGEGGFFDLSPSMEEKSASQWSFTPLTSPNNKAGDGPSIPPFGSARGKSVGKHRLEQSLKNFGRSKSWSSSEFSERMADDEKTWDDFRGSKEVEDEEGEEKKKKKRRISQKRSREAAKTKQQQKEDQKEGDCGLVAWQLRRSNSAPNLSVVSPREESPSPSPGPGPEGVTHRKLKSKRNISSADNFPPKKDTSPSTNGNGNQRVLCFLELKNELIKGALVVTKGELTFYPAGYSRPIVVYPLAKILSIVSCNSSLVVPDSIAVSTRTRKSFFRGIVNRDDELKEMLARWKCKVLLSQNSVTSFGTVGSLPQVRARRDGDPIPLAKQLERKEKESPVEKGGGGRGAGNGTVEREDSKAKIRIITPGSKKSKDSVKRPGGAIATPGSASGGGTGGVVGALSGGGKMRIIRRPMSAYCPKTVTPQNSEGEDPEAGKGLKGLKGLGVGGGGSVGTGTGTGAGAGTGEVRDPYGFLVPKGLVDAYSEWKQKEREGAVLLRGHWAKYLQGDFDVVEEKLPRKKLKKLVEEGVYPPIRPKVWALLAGLKALQTQAPEGFYWELSRKTESSVSMAQIKKDVHRTFPEHSYFQNESGSLALYRILIAYSNYNPQLGYCQAMNFIAGVLLVVMKDEETVFWALVALINNYLHEYFSRSLIGSLVDNKVFEVLLSETQPKLYNHLQQVGYPLGIITTKWFMCLYAEASIPTETLLRVWDSFFLLGVDQLIYAGLTIFRIFEKEMLKCQDPEDVRNILREQPSSLFDADKFTKTSKQIKSSIKMASIQKLRSKIFCEISADLHSFSVSRKFD